MNTNTEQGPVIWRSPLFFWGLVALGLIITGIVFQSGIVHMFNSWGREEYSYAYFLPLIAGYFIWSKKHLLRRMAFNGSWFGLVIMAAGVMFYVFGELSSLYTIVEYGYIITLAGMAIAITSTQGARVMWPAFVLLLFMVPLPNYLQQMLSAKLQLLSSEIGVAVIRLFGISVYLEGNVIDLGSMKLQVVEACNGLRYLFPLMALGYIAAYLYREKLWKKIVIFLSTIPITVLMNSVRIGLIGVTVEYFGSEAALGVLHDFEGWVVFMISSAVLIVEMWLLLKIGKQKKTLREVFSFETVKAESAASRIVERKMPMTTIPVIALLAAALAAAVVLPQREEIKTARKMFTELPNPISAWAMKIGSIEQVYLDSLKLTDYHVSDYVTENGTNINLYMAYYASQRKGESVHSPATCIPAGGWEITDMSVRTVTTGNIEMPVNRTIVQRGDQKQLVYYWFPQRGRVITNEYLAKWYIFQDSITRNRSDGGLVRISAAINNNHPIEQTEAELQRLIQAVTPLLNSYIPI